MNGQVGLMGVLWPSDLASWNLNYSPPAFSGWSWQLAPPHPLPLANTFKGERCFSDGSHFLLWNDMRERKGSLHFLPCLQTVRTTSESWHRSASSQVSSLCHKEPWRAGGWSKNSLLCHGFPSPERHRNWTPESSGRMRETRSPGKLSLWLFYHSQCISFLLGSIEVNGLSHQIRSPWAPRQQFMLIQCNL